MPPARGKGGLPTLPGKHHYDIIDGFLGAESLLCAAILRRMGIG